MKTKFIAMLLLFCSAAIISCESETAIDTSVMSNPILAFEYDVTSGRTYEPSIDNEAQTITMANASTGDDITAVRFLLADGVSITPNPLDRVGKWRDTELFILSKGDVELPYTVILSGK